MSDYQDRPLISSQDDPSPPNSSSGSGGGCLSTLLGAAFWIFVIAFVLKGCFGGGGDSETPTSDQAPTAAITQSDDWSEPSEEEGAARGVSGFTDGLSEEALQLHKLLFHGYYTDMGTVEIYEFEERAELLKNMVQWMGQIEEKAVNIKYQKPFFQDGYYSLSHEYTDKIYIGDLKDNRPHGWGMIFETINGDAIYDSSDQVIIAYAGEFDDGKMDGYGAEFSPAHKIEIAFQEAADTGCVAEENANILAYYLLNHVYYEGCFENNEWSGKGNQFRFLVDNNTVYLFNDPINGYIFANAYPNITTGIFEDSEAKENLKVYKDNWLQYEGEMKNDYYHGEGTSYYRNGQIQYTGEWKKDEYHGKGSYYDEQGNLIYKGEWKNGDYDT